MSPSLNSFGARSTLNVGGRTFTYYSLAVAGGAASAASRACRSRCASCSRTWCAPRTTSPSRRTTSPRWPPGTPERRRERDRLPARPRPHAGPHRRARDRRPRRDARRDGRPRRRPAARSTRCSPPSWSSTTRCRSTSTAPAAPSCATPSWSWSATASATPCCAGARRALTNFKVVPPDTGIVHQVNLECLARVVFQDERRRRADGLPRHRDRHRLPHDDDQRPRRARLGRRRHRGRGVAARASPARC